MRLELLASHPLCLFFSRFLKSVCRKPFCCQDSQNSSLQLRLLQGGKCKPALPKETWLQAECSDIWWWYFLLWLYDINLKSMKIINTQRKLENIMLLNLPLAPGGGPFKTELSTSARAQCQHWCCSVCAYTELMVSTSDDFWQKFFFGRNEREILISIDYLKEQLLKQFLKIQDGFLKSGTSACRTPKGKGSHQLKSRVFDPSSSSRTLGL